MWQEFRRVLQTEGLRGIWIRIMGRTIYRRLILVERLLDEPDPALETEPTLTFALLRPDQIADYCNFRAEARPDEVRNRLESGLKCFAASRNNEILAVVWAATQTARIAYLGSEIPLQPGEAYIFDSYTSPQHRGRNVAGTRSLQMIQYMRNAGYKRLIATILPENKPAFRAVSKLGYKPFALIGRWKIGPWRRNFYSTQRRKGA
jgi:ribosomal protein S18 acetylase RimI-like enzyme